MAVTGSYAGVPAGDEETDLGVLWQQALSDYCAESDGTDLIGTDPTRWNMGRILAEQEEQLVFFSQFRHDKGRVDKLRTLVSQNSTIIQNVAASVATAASSAFPPSAAILTCEAHGRKPLKKIWKLILDPNRAFNYVLNASKAVSDDYDMVVQFFDIVHSFLERISMLENRMPELKSFQVFLLRVFRSLLTLAAIARKYRMGQGRLKKWAKALVEKNDSKLTAAFESLHAQLQGFEQATMIATLRTTIDTSKKLDSFGNEFRGIQSGVDQAVDLGKQGLVQGREVYAIGRETLTVATDGNKHAMEAAFKTREILDLVNRQDGTEQKQTATMKRIEGKIERMKTTQPQRGGGKSGAAEAAMDSGARKSMALRLVWSAVCPWGDDTKDQLSEIESTFLNGTFQWHRDLEAFNDFRRGDIPVFWLTGPSGMGKSSLMFSMEKTLREEFEGEPNTSVAYFFFREDDDRYRKLSRCLQSCAVQAATQDVAYREELLADIQRIGEKKWYKNRRNVKKLWKRLFASKFSKESRHRIVLLLDGVDEAEGDDIGALIDIFRSSAAAENNISILFSSDPGLLERLADIRHTRFDLDRDRVSMDMKLVVTARLKQLPRLRKLRPGIKAKIGRRICKKADSMRYIDHMLRRLNSIGREAPIMKQLENFPEDTTGVYEILLEDCERSRNDQDREVLRKFFAWLAYCKEPLSMGTATKLLEYIANGNLISVDDEVEHKSAAILRLSNSTQSNNDQEEEATDNETDKEADDNKNSDDDEVSAGDNDTYILLGFQERSLRQYFCKDGTATGLRSPPNLGHMMIFEGISAILTSGNTDARTSTRVDRILVRYATQHWMSHLLEIKCKELEDAQAAKVIEGLHAILSNRNNALKFFQARYYDDDDSYSIFGPKSEDQGKARDALKDWATRAISLSSSILAPGIAEWMRPLVRNPDVTYIRIAEAHVANWFINPVSDFGAYRSFLFAHNALERGRKLLKPQSELHKYFAEREGAKDRKPTEKAILAVPNFFWQLQMTMTAQGYRAIGMALKSREFYEASLVQFEEGLKFADDDRDMLQVYSTMGQALVSLAQKAKETLKEEEKNKSGTSDVGQQSDTGANANEASAEEAVEQNTAAAVDNSISVGQATTTGKHDADPNSEADAVIPRTPGKQPLIDWAAKAGDTLNEAAKLIPKVASMYSTDLDKDVEIKDAVVTTYVMRAKAELLQGRSENLIMYLTGAIQVPCRHRSITDIIEIILKLASMKEWHRIVELIKILGRDDRINVFWSNWNSELAECLQRAGKETGELQFTIDMYEGAWRLLASWGASKAMAGYIFLPLAIFLRTVVRGDEARARAKQLLAKTLDVSEDSNMLSEASFQMADVLVEDFRSTRDPVRKMTAQAEMKALAARVRENMGADFDYTQSQITIPLAYMTRRLHAVEFQRGLEATFQGCVQLLRDSTAVNDSPSLRTLARVLAYVPGLGRDSRIAATCQLYIVDMELQKREETAHVSEDEDEDGDESAKSKTEKNGDKTVRGTSEEKEETSRDVKQESEVESKEDEADATKTPHGEAGPATFDSASAQTESPEPVLTNGLTDGTSNGHDEVEESEKKSSEAKEAAEEETLDDYDPKHKLCISCKNCRKTMDKWDIGAMYLCYYCTELDICEECYDNNKAREGDWRTLCPPGHKHIKAPVEGWKGLKNGVMKFEAEEIKFVDWLEDLQEKRWADAWERFWSEEMRD